MAGSIASVVDIVSDKSINEIAAGYGVHPQQVRAWRRKFLERMHLAFEKDRNTVALGSCEGV